MNPGPADEYAIEFMDPPPPKRGGRNMWRENLKPLIDRPGEWARVRRAPSRAVAQSTVSHFRSNRATLPPGRWEFACRVSETGADVYAKYLGPDDDA